MSTERSTNRPASFGEFCELHWSWLCQEGAGNCQGREAPGER